MDYKVNKPLIPIIFLDTFVYIDIVKYQNGVNVHYGPKLEELKNLILQLVDEGKLLCPRGAQSEECELTAIENDVNIEMERLAFGLEIQHYYAVEDNHIRRAIKAKIENIQRPELSYKNLLPEEWEETVEAHRNNDYFLTTILPAIPEITNQVRATRQNMANDIEALRLEKRRNNYSYESLLEAERLGTKNAIVSALPAVEKLQRGGQLTQEEYDSVLAVYKFTGPYQDITGRDIDISEVIDFLGSEHFYKLPNQELYSRMYASLLIQDSPVITSDMFDFKQASYILPYATFFLTDRKFANRLRSDKVRAEEFGVKVYSYQELDQLLEDLRQLL